jgi:hypothetical protein
MKIHFGLLLLIGLIVAYQYFKPISKIDPSIPPTQNDIQTLQYVNKEQFKEEKNKYNDDFPYPQISNAYHRLSKGELTSSMHLQDLILPNNSGPLTHRRTTDTPENMNTQRIYVPDYYRKDTLSANDIGSEEMRSFLTDSEESESSWSDTNVSKHPKFYTSDGPMNELTNIGSFFDKNNNYHDKSSNNTNVLPSDNCFIDKSGDIFCESATNTLIPPQLITDVKNCQTLNQIGSYSKINYTDSGKDRLMNGGSFFNSILPSVKDQDNYSKPIEPQLGDCSL